MNESDRRLAALTFAALVFGLSFAGGFYTQASLSDEESFGGTIGAAANFGAGNDDGTVDTYDTTTAGNDGTTTDTDNTETSTSDSENTDTSTSDSDNTDTSASDSDNTDASGNDGDSCTGNTGNTDCDGSASFVSPGSGVAAPTADRRSLPANL
jgi:hypothetical protein